MAQVVQYRHRRRLVDLTTGETVTAVALIPEARDAGFTKIFDLFSNEILAKIGVMNGELKLLVFFLAKTKDSSLQSDGWIPLTQKEMAQAIGVSARTVQNYLRKLKACGFIEQDRHHGYLWRIRPELVYRGSLVRYFSTRVSEISESGGRNI